MKRLSIHCGVCFSKLHFKISEKEKKQKSMLAMLVHTPFTSGKSLWVLSQTNFLSFILQSPGQHSQTFLPDLRNSCQEAKNLRVHYLSSVQQCGGSLVLRKRWSFVFMVEFFFHSIQNRKLSPNRQTRLHLKEISQTTESYFLHPLFESAS